MKRLAIGSAAVALALLTFFQFPGHTWLQQDSQIYVPVLEHQRDASVLRNDILVEHPSVAFTLWDESARFLRGFTGLGFRDVLAFQQVATRALGIWGLYLMATALGLATGPALLVSAICSLGAAIAGPAVLTFEYEPTPRAFAVPLVICAMGLASRKRYEAAGVAGAAAFLYHPPTALAFWALAACAALRNRRAWALAPLAAAAVVLLIAALSQGGASEAHAFVSRLTPLQEQLQRMRAPYVWISTWPVAVIAGHFVLAAILVAALVRLWKDLPFELRVFLAGLPLLGLASMPLSWLLLELAGWALVPQFQPMRMLLFVALAMQFLTAAAGTRAAVARRPAEALAWFALAYLLPLQPAAAWRQLALAVALGAVAAAAVRLAPRLAPAGAVAAFFAIPWLGAVTNYPQLHTPELAQLAAWARSSTPRDAVFVFPDAGRALYPGVFRSEALRAVYVDWKGGGQVNYLQDLGEQWWFRWQQTMAREFRPADLPRYDALGIRYVVLRSPPRPGPPVFENAGYAVYRTP